VARPSSPPNNRSDFRNATKVQCWNENTKKSGASQRPSSSEPVSKGVAELADWREETLRRMRKLISGADLEAVEQWKWTGTQIWPHEGIISTRRAALDVLKVDGQVVDTQKILRTIPFRVPVDEIFDVGLGTPHVGERTGLQGFVRIQRHET
jgi:hypothetical protein